MFTKKIFFFFIFFFIFCQSVYCQQKPIEKDSTKIYRKIETYSKKNKFTKLIHKLIFNPITKKSKSKRRSSTVPTKNYLKFEGKKIRNIEVVTLDPFGYSENDTAVKPDKFSYRIGNTLHRKTRNFAIKNLLLFKKNELIDSVIFKESERLIRSQRFVSRIAITVNSVTPTSDSVDVKVRVIDSWSISPNVTVSTNKTVLGFNERNFLGFGHNLKYNFQKSLNSSDNASDISYTVPTIKNSYLETSIFYKIDLDGNYRKGIQLQRPFYSPLVRWAGGLSTSQEYYQTITLDTSLVEVNQNFKFNNQDYWLGHSFQIFKGNLENYRSTNLITSIRYFKTQYVEKPNSNFDPLQFFSTEEFYLAGIGVSSRQFVQDKYLYKYGFIEDVPTGFVYGLTGGLQNKISIKRYYAGARFALGRYYKWGYLSSNVEYGTFLNNSFSEQSAIVFKMIYFTNLVETSRWKFRQFIKPEFIIGNDRKDSMYDELSINDNNGIQGFSSDLLKGTKKIVLTLQTQAYSPWNIAGFRCDPYLSTTIGMLGNAASGFKNSKVYSQFGIGFIVSNDFLVFNSFQVSLSYYPSVPGVGNNVLKNNAFKSNSFGFQDFDFSKPRIVPYLTE